MKLIRYVQSYFAVVPAGHSEEKFAKGQCYPITDESQRHVDQGIAEIIDAPEDAEKAVAAAESAEAKAAKAAETAEAARATADVAVAAASLVQPAAADKP